VKEILLFSINDYDKDGDISDEGIFLHFDDTRIKVAKDIKEFDQVIESLKTMRNEIAENY